MKKTILDDGSYPYLTEGAELVGMPGIPALMDIDNTQVPKAMLPFEKIKKAEKKRQYVHFYMHDKYFAKVLTATDKYVDLLKEFDGVITPDCTMLVGQAPCIQQTNTYFNRAVGFYLQKQGIPVIPNIRWSDESSFDYCFLGVPKHKIVCVSTHGCIRSKRDRELWQIGTEEIHEEEATVDIPNGKGRIGRHHVRYPYILDGQVFHGIYHGIELLVILFDHDVVQWSHLSFKIWLIFSKFQQFNSPQTLYDDGCCLVGHSQGTNHLANHTHRMEIGQHGFFSIRYPLTKHTNLHSLAFSILSQSQ
jgi:hypothetical protein